MDDAGKTVFLSYRREISWPQANAVRGALDGFDAVAIARLSVGPWSNTVEAH